MCLWCVYISVWFAGGGGDLPFAKRSFNYWLLKEGLDSTQHFIIRDCEPQHIPNLSSLSLVFPLELLGLMYACIQMILCSFGFNVVSLTLLLLLFLSLQFSFNFFCLILRKCLMRFCRFVNYWFILYIMLSYFKALCSDCFISVLA